MRNTDKTRGDTLKIDELENIILKSASNVMKKRGETLLNNGEVTYCKGRKIDNIYHVYGRVKDEGKPNELNTHIKIDLLKKKLQGVECSCEEFKEFALEGYTFMCSHLTATSFKFLKAISKDKTLGVDIASQSGKTEESIKTVGNTVLGRLVRKVEKASTYYEAQAIPGGEKIILKPNDLRAYLEGLKNDRIKFKFEYLELVTPIYHKDLPLTFNLKEAEGRIVVTTHKQLPVPLNSNNDVYFLKNQLYLPSRKQIERYVPLYEKFKAKGEIGYKKDINNYNKLIYLLKSIGENINISESLRYYMSKQSKPEFYMYEDKGRVYCEVFLSYGDHKINILKEDKNESNLIRDFKKENRILMEVEKRCFVRAENRFLFIGGDSGLYEILTSKGDSIVSLGKIILGKGLKEIKVYNSSSIEANIYEQQDWYGFNFNIEDIEYGELGSAFEAFKAKQSFYKTKNRGFMDLEEVGFKDFFNLFEVLNIKESLKEGSVKIDKSKALYMYESIKNKGLNFIEGSEALEEIERKLSNLNASSIEIPKKLKGTLREYQICGFRWLKTLSELHFGGILADEMGLGKTIQAIAFLLSEEDKKTIIVCPTSLIYNWKDEFEKFAPSLKVGIVHGTERLQVIENIDEYDVLLTTYGTLRLDIEHYNNCIFDFCIIDEGQNIKNAAAQNTKVTKEIKAQVRFALTGTPIENNLSELWSIFDFVMPGYLYSKEKFEEKFLGSSENLESLKLLISPFILRRTKAQVMKELPDKIEKKFLVEMTDAQKAVYSTYIESVRALMKKSGEGKIEIFSYLTKLRQLCLDPSLVMEDYNGGNSKLEVALELIKNHTDSGGKVLLFSQFTSVLDKIGETLEGEGIEYYRIDGKTKPKDRLEKVKAFNSSKDIKVFLISLKAGGTGLNLTSANLVIHFDPWWNPAVEDQATDRAHRIGQREIVEVIKLVAKGTVEEKIIELQKDKKELINNILTGDLENSRLINGLSKEELMELFNKD